MNLFGRSDIWFHDSLYMKRWKLISLRLFGIRVHHILRSDADRELHDHPFDFISVILSGSYTEYLADGTVTTYKAGSILFRRAETLHRLELSAPVWTFVIRGRIRREWGFMTYSGWIHWTTFNKIRGYV